MCVCVRVIGFVVVGVRAASRRPRATPSLFNLFMLDAAPATAVAAADSVRWVGTQALC